MFKVITMSDKLVSEQFTFTHPFLCDDSVKDACKMQRITLSRDLSKLMEVYDDSKCKIYTKESTVNKKVIW